MIALTGLAVLVTACRSRQDFWVILNSAALIFPVYSAWVLYRLCRQDGWPNWMPVVLLWSILGWCWVVLGLNVAQPTEEEITLAQCWLGLAAFVVASGAMKIGRPRPVPWQR
jgi:hypothetical protein